MVIKHPYKKIASLLVMTYLKDNSKNLTEGNLNRALDSIAWAINYMVLPITIKEGYEYVDNKFSQSYWKEVLNELYLLTVQDIINARQEL